MKKNMSTKRKINYSNNLFFTASENDSENDLTQDSKQDVSTSEVKTHKAESSCSDGFADVIKVLNKSIPLLKENKEPSSAKLKQYSLCLEKFLSEMKEYEQKKIPSSDGVSPEQNMQNMQNMPLYLYLRNNIVLEGLPVNNLIRQTRNIYLEHTHFINESVKEAFLECRRVIFHSFTLVGLVTIEIDFSFFFKKQIEFMVGDYSFNTFHGFNSQRLQAFGDDILHKFDSVWGNMIAFRCQEDNFYGSSESSFLGYSEEANFMFAITPSQFNVIEGIYKEYLGSFNHRLKDGIVDLLNEYTLNPKRCAEEKYDLQAQIKQTKILKRLVRNCDSKGDLRELISKATSTYPLSYESFVSTGNKISSLIEGFPTPYIFRKKEFKSTEASMDSSFTSSSSSCSNNSSCASSSSSSSGSGMFKNKYKKGDLEELQTAAFRTRIGRLVPRIKTLQKESGEKYSLCSENVFKSLKHYIDYLTAHHNRLAKITNTTIKEIENQFEESKISTKAFVI